mgnify:CR=1 FL=1
MLQMSKCEPPYIEYILDTPEDKIQYEKLMALYDSVGTKSSPLSKFGDDSEIIKS